MKAGRLLPLQRRRDAPRQLRTNGWPDSSPRGPRVLKIAPVVRAPARVGFRRNGNNRSLTGETWSWRDLTRSVGLLGLLPPRFTRFFAATTCLVSAISIG